MNEKCISDIMEMEWSMFSNVQNRGGTAPCQQDQKTFLVMRLSQMMNWTEPMLESYREDLKDALKQGRNLMTEKYGHMMRHTVPMEYEQIRAGLPVVSAEALALADRITILMVRWAEESTKRYPKLLKAGRPIESKEDTAHVTSLETYTRGELLTYSFRTLQLVWAFVSEEAKAGRNHYEAVLTNTARFYGYADMTEMESAL